MAFTGSEIVTQVSDQLVRITGVSLALGASGTIALYGGAGDIVLPASFQPRTYDVVTLQDSLEVDVNPLGTTGLVPSVVKTGAAPDTFLATVTAASAAPVSDALTMNLNAAFPGGGGIVYTVDDVSIVGGLSYVGLIDHGTFVEVQWALANPIAHSARIELESVHMHPTAPLDPFVPVVINIAGAADRVLMGFPIDAALIPPPGSPTAIIGASYALVRTELVDVPLEIYVRFH